MTEQKLTYAELKALISKALGGVEVKPSTLSRWMRILKYPKGQPFKKRGWDIEDAIALSSLGIAYSLDYQGQNAIDYAVNQVEKYRQWHSIPMNLSDLNTPATGEPSRQQPRPVECVAK